MVVMMVAILLLMNDPSHAGMGGCIFEYPVCMCCLRLKHLPTHIQSPHSQMNALRLARPVATFVRRPAGNFL